LFNKTYNDRKDYNASYNIISGIAGYGGSVAIYYGTYMITRP